MKRNAMLDTAMVIVALGTLSCDRTMPDSPLAPRSANLVGQGFPGTLQCNGGGSAKVAGAATNEVNSKGNGERGVNLVIKLDDCRWSSPLGNIEVDGAPNLIMHAHRAVVNGVLQDEIIGTMKGMVDWTVNGQTQLCRFDAGYRVKLNGAREVTIDGTECEKFLLLQFFALD